MAETRCLIVQHVKTAEGASFKVVRQQPFREAPAVLAPSPTGFPVEGRPHSDLMIELRWYLEQFLDYPFPPETGHAERVQEALKAWGEAVFAALFSAGAARDLYADTRNNGLDKLLIAIASDEPGILMWPWEAMADPEAGVLGKICRFERRPSAQADPAPLPDELPRDRVNILMVTARPYERDVRYRSMSRPLVELIERGKLPASVTVLRPPTLAQLRAHLRERPHHYHILHFDGHGTYGVDNAVRADGHRLKGGAQGHLVFEDDDGKEDLKSAEQLADLLREFRVPAVVLNACQSGRIDAAAEDVFASVAASLLRAGMRSVVAMAYSLYVSGGQRFLPGFYGRLFATGQVPEAVWAGRQEMAAEPGRICARGRFPLEDWLVPVLYQQADLDFGFAARATGGAPAMPEMPEGARDTDNPYGFIGRDGAVLALERALRRPPAGILIQGLGGIGKTTLARGFLHWLGQTGGLGNGAFWFQFQEIRNAEYVFNRMADRLFGPNARAAATGDKLAALAKAFREHPFVIVWDNFEAVAGNAGSLTEPALPPEERAHLLRFLKLLRGGRTKVIITSRDPEDWLGDANRYLLPLGGLQGEERWEFCETILRDQGVNPSRADPKLTELMDLLAGHPLSMRVLLPRLARCSASELIQTLQANLAASKSGDPAEAKLFATLKVVEDDLPDDLKPLLIPLALHRRIVDADYLEVMAKSADTAMDRPRIDRFVGRLTAAGVLRQLGSGVYEIHPLLGGFLRARLQPGPPQDAWSATFVAFMAAFANHVTPWPLHEQRGVFHAHGANFEAALRLAEARSEQTPIMALTQSLAAYAENTRDFDRAHSLYETLRVAMQTAGIAEGEAGACHQLGVVAQERRDFVTAEAWYRKSLEIEERLGNETGAASSYGQLGMVALERRDFDAAEAWYRKGLEVMERLGNETEAAVVYHQLGMVALECRDFDAAEAWYRKSLEIKERLRNEAGAATTYHQLGIVAEERRDLDAAEAWYRKSLEIEERLGDETAAASTYGQLGAVALMRRDFDAAGRWTVKAAAIFRHMTAMHELGIVMGLFQRVLTRAGDGDRIRLRKMWDDAALPPLPPPDEEDADDA